MEHVVLLVEDDPLTARALARMLTSGLKIDVTHVDTNHAAIEFLSTTTPSLVITDLVRHGGSGDQLVAYIREDARLRTLPVVVVSGTLFRGSDPRLFEYRIDGALAKPVAVETLLRVVTRGLAVPAAPMNADEALIRLGAESRSLDYKRSIDIDDKKQRACVAKDVIAFFNSGGGTIVVGVDEDSGCFVQRGLPEAEAQKLEVTRLNQALRRYIGTELSVRARRAVYNGKLFVIITVPGVSTKLAFAKEEHPEAGLYPGRFYSRNDAAETVEVRDWSTLEDMFERVLAERARQS